MGPVRPLASFRQPPGVAYQTELSLPGPCPHCKEPCLATSTVLFPCTPILSQPLRWGLFLSETLVYWVLPTVYRVLPT